MSAGRADRWQFVKFVVAAGLSVPVNLAARVLLSRVMAYEVAIVLSHLCGMLVAYALTRTLVFGTSGRHTSIELARFALINLMSLFVTWLFAVGLLRLVFPQIGFDKSPQLAAHVLALAVASVTSFYGHRRYSFARR
ncbi:MAG: GtrA family protein [Geminicoccaceae bacterium]